MFAFVITTKESQDIESPIFYAGASGEEEAIAVFTSAQRGQSFIEQAGWQESEQVVKLDPIDLLQLLIQSLEEGVAYLVVDPEQQSQEEGVPQPVLSVREQLADLGQTLIGRLFAPATPEDESS